jgi:hypothetical protein
VPIEVFLYSHDAKGVQFLFTLPNFQLVWRPLLCRFSALLLHFNARERERERAVHQVQELVCTAIRRVSSSNGNICGLEALGSNLGQDTG